MKKLFKFKHWQVFSIFIFLYIIIGVTSKYEISVAGISSLKLNIACNIIFICVYFSWLTTIGYLLNQKNGNSYLFRNWLLIIAGILCIIGYSLLHLQKLELKQDIIPIWLSVLSVPFTFWGIIYLLKKVSKSLKSIELGRESKISEYFIYIILFVFFPIGIWFIQPKLNRIYNSTENIN